MKNYIKGEWRLNNYHHPYQFIVAHGGPEDNDAFPGQRKICSIWDWDTEKGKVNAHLIVSAPKLKQQRDDLRDACKRMLGAMTCDELNNGQVFNDDLRKEVKNEAKAAIAKAKA